jgi:hypothetical protein
VNAKASAWILTGGAALLLSCAHTVPPAPAEAAAEGAATAFARFKAVTGGARWDEVKVLQTHGVLAAAGLSGPLDGVQDVRTGRSAQRYQLGKLEGADGFDGTNAWRKDPGGEVTVLDAPEAKRLARAEAWLASLGYWYPERSPAAFGPLRAGEEEGVRYQIVEVTPAGASPLTLWVDASTGLLARTVQKRGDEVVTSRLDDYRETSGVRVPFHLSQDVTDAAGRTDPRAHVEIRLESVAINPQIDAAALAMPAMAPRARTEDASGSTRVPFELINNHIYLAATVDGKPVRMLVDTGGVNLLTTASADRLGLASEGKLPGRGGGDEHVDVGTAHGREIRLGSAVLRDPVFYVIALDPLPAMEGTDLDGLVGFEMFRRLRVTIDYAARVLTLTDPGRFSPPASGQVVPFDLADRTPIVSGDLDGLPVRLTIDTGSRASLTMHSPFVRQHDLVARYSAAPERVTGWGVGGPSRGRPARLGTLTLGGAAIRDIASDLYLGDKGSFANPDISGNLGGGILRRFTVTFDYDAKKMYLVPNAHFAEPDSFDRSGLWLAGDGEALKVVAVAPGSAGEKAGVAEGSRVVQIDGTPVSRRPLSDWRARLREGPPGTRVVLTLAEASGTRSVAIVLADAIPPHAAPPRR